MEPLPYWAQNGALPFEGDWEEAAAWGAAGGVNAAPGAAPMSRA